MTRLLLRTDSTLFIGAKNAIAVNAWMGLGWAKKRMFAVLWPQVNSGLVSPSSFPAKEERHFHAQKVTHISTPFTFSACSPVNSLPSLLSSQIIRIPFPLASAVLFTCGEAGRSMDHNWPLFVVCLSCQSSQGSLYRPEKHGNIGNWGDWVQFWGQPWPPRSFWGCHSLRGHQYGW